MSKIQQLLQKRRQCATLGSQSAPSDGLEGERDGGSGVGGEEAAGRGLADGVEAAGESEDSGLGGTFMDDTTGQGTDELQSGTLGELQVSVDGEPVDGGTLGIPVPSTEDGPPSTTAEKTDLTQTETVDSEMELEYMLSTPSSNPFHSPTLTLTHIPFKPGAILTHNTLNYRARNSLASKILFSGNGGSAWVFDGDWQLLCPPSTLLGAVNHKGVLLPPEPLILHVGEGFLHQWFPRETLVRHWVTGEVMGKSGGVLLTWLWDGEGKMRMVERGERMETISFKKDLWRDQ